MFWNKKLNEKISKLEKELENLKYIDEKSRIIRSEYESILLKNDELIKDNNNLKSQLREDTEADIYFSCAKIQKKLINGEDKYSVKNDIINQNSMLNQLQAYQPPYLQQLSPLANLFNLGKQF